MHSNLRDELQQISGGFNKVRVIIETCHRRSYSKKHNAYLLPSGSN